MNRELRADRDRAVRVKCPVLRCDAEPGDPCINLGTGRPLEHLPAHAARLRAAGVAHAPLDSRDLQRAD